MTLYVLWIWVNAQWDASAILVAYRIITALNAALPQMFTPAPHTWKLLSFYFLLQLSFPACDEVESYGMWSSQTGFFHLTLCVLFSSLSPWLENSLASLLNKIQCLDAIWSVCPSTYGRLSWIVVSHVVIDIYVQVLCKCKISTSLGNIPGNMKARSYGEIVFSLIKSCQIICQRGPAPFWTILCPRAKWAIYSWRLRVFHFLLVYSEPLCSVDSFPYTRPLRAFFLFSVPKIPAAILRMCDAVAIAASRSQGEGKGYNLKSLV